MKKKILNIFQGDRKYFTIVFFIFALLFASAVLTPSVIENKRADWNKELFSKINDIEISVNNQFSKKTTSLLNLSGNLKNDLKNIFTSGDEAYREIIKILNRKSIEDYSIGIFAPNSRLIAWNNPVVITQDELFPLNSPLGEIYFYDTDLITYLSLIDSVIIDNDIFFLTISKPIEKKYILSNKYFKPAGFIKELADKHEIDFEVAYNPFFPKTRDGTKYSFDLVNNFGTKIGLVTFSKPLLDNELNSIKETSSNIQAILVLLLFFFTILGMKNDFKSLTSRLLKSLLLLLSLVLGRIILFLTNIPAAFISGDLVDPSNFSSVFAWGIVKSPLEFLITNIFVIVLAVNLYRYAMSYSLEKTGKKYHLLLKVLSVPMIITFVLLIRAFAASTKSVIFDSTIRYFKEPEIIPDLTSLVMHLNILLLSVSILLAMLCLLFIIFKIWDLSRKLKPDINYFILSILLLLLSILFYFIQTDPLITLFMMVLFVIIILILLYFIRIKNHGSVFNYVYITLAASIISVTFFNYFNVKLERESLKTTAYEINRANENLLQFLIEETLRNAVATDEIRSVFGSRVINYDAAAFRLWSKSSIQKESFNAFIALYDRNRNILGKFNIGLSENLNLFEHIKPHRSEEPVVQEVLINDNIGTKYFAGLLPFYEREILSGYLAVAVSFDLQSIGANYFPDFLESSTSILNRVVDIRQLKVFEFTNNMLSQVYGDRYPSREQIKEITSANLSKFNDGWIRLTFEGENFVTFILKTFREETETITAVLVAEKEFTWNLFNFFKVFIVHSFFILILIVGIFLAKVRKINYTFKSKLLIAFLLVSIIPVIFLAVYNRQAVTERANEAVISELKQRSMYLENHIEYQRNRNPDRNLHQIFENAARELNISFSVYKGTDEIYNSRNIFNRIGMFDKKLNSKAHYFLNYLKFREYLTKEKVENYSYEALYRSVNVDNEEYILSVNDAFNKFRVSFATVEIDVVIFGIYSFAVILIIIISTIFANQISNPIRRLTKATESVGQGDLNIKIEHSERGELRDLLDGFNAMTSELQKNQAELANLERETAWKEMAKQVAHEIKNPLTPMKLALQQLSIAYRDKNKDFDSLFQKVSKTVLTQIENLSQIASEFSRFAKMPSLNLEIMDLVITINDTIDLYQDEKVKIEFISQLDTAPIEGDRSHIRRVFINLIRNSIQANAGSVKIELKKINTKYMIEVIDNGSGIPEELQEKIFTQSYTTKEKGMGLGLVITKRFIESINGTIRLKSSKPGETIFEIVISAVENQIVS
ncbi:MAG: ATP-binding protein [Ignavibacteriaceae bacterium]